MATATAPYKGHSDWLLAFSTKIKEFSISNSRHTHIHAHSKQRKTNRKKLPNRTHIPMAHTRTKAARAHFLVSSFVFVSFPFFIFIHFSYIPQFLFCFLNLDTHTYITAFYRFSLISHSLNSAFSFSNRILFEIFNRFSF